MTASRRTSGWLLALGSLLLVTLFAGLGYRDAHTRNVLWTLQLAQQSQLQARALGAAQHQLQGQAELIAATLSADPEVLSLMRQAAAALDAGLAAQSTDLVALRQQLRSELAPFWDGMQAHQARQLVLYAGASATTVLRMHAPDSFGDRDAAQRPMLAKVIRDGERRSGLDAGPFGPGNRAVVPLFDGTPAMRVIGALEVGFGLLPPASSLSQELEAGVAVILDRARLAPIMWVPVEGRPLAGRRNWLLTEGSDTKVLDWARLGSLPDPGEGRAMRVIQADAHKYLLTQVPLAGAAGTPLAVVLTWRDITAQAAEHRAASEALKQKWWLAWLVAQALLIAVLVVYRRRSAMQERHRQALHTINEIAALPWSDEGAAPLEEALTRALGFLGLEQALLLDYRRGQWQVSRFAGSGAPVTELDLDRPPYDALQHAAPDQVLQLDDVRRPVEGTGEAGETGSLIGMPLWLEGRLRGALLFRSSQPRRRRFDDADSSFLHLVVRWLLAALTRERQERDRRALLGRAEKIARHLPGAMYQLQQLTDGRYRFLYASEGMREIYGVGPQELEADASQAFERIHPDDRQRIDELLLASIERVGAGLTEYRVLHPEKGLLWIEGRSTAERLADGTVVWHGFLADISERKRIEERLLIERQRAAGILEATQVGTGEWHITEDTMTVDVRWAEIVGDRQAQAETMPVDAWRQRMHPDDLEAFRASMARHFADPQSLFEHDFRLRHRDGRWLWVRSRGRVLRRDEAGLPQVMYGVIMDISQARQAQEENRRTRAHLEAVVQASTEVAIIATDRQGLITLFNVGAERLLGVPADQVVGRREATSFFDPLELAERGRSMSAAFGRTIAGFDILVAIARTGTPETRHWTFHHPLSGQRLISVTVTAIFGALGTVDGYLGIVTDITELQEATRALQKSESRFRGMVANLPGVVYRCSNDAERTLQYVSEGIERLTGYPAGDFFDSQARRYHDLIHPDDRQAVQEQFLLQPDGSYEASYRLLRADGRVIWVHDKSRAQFDRDGELLWIDGFIWDITARVHAQGQAREREDYLRKLIANVIDGIITIDERGRIETFNHAAERIFGWRSDEVLGHNLSLLMPEPVRGEHDSYLSRYAGREKSGALELNREMVAQRRDGETFTIELRVSEITHHGERKFIGLVRDITERKRIERMKSEFVSIVSHELRTPLTSISAALGLATGGALGELSPTLGQMLGIAHQNSQRLARLIDDLLDMDKLVAGKMTFTIRRQPLAPLLEEAVRMTGDYARQHQVAFVLHPVAPHWQVAVDEVRLHQVLANFLSNAAKFSPAGANVELDARECDAWVRVSVRDRGPGIPEAFRARIFQKFSQADSSDTREKGGTGLGLAISKELVERMQGRIGYDSAPGQGACFWFELPLAEERG